MTLTLPSRMACALTRTHRQSDIMTVANRCTLTSHFSTLTPTDVMLKESDESERNATRQQSHVIMSPRGSDRNPFELKRSSVEDAGWTNSLRQDAATTSSLDIKRVGWHAPPTSDNEFDPILNIRAMNPLIFESNYDLEEYGPSFEKKAEHHDVLIQEWRIRYDRAI